MGMLRSKTYADNITVNGVLLGQPVIVNDSGDAYAPGDDITALWFAWDDSAFPTGVCEVVDGVLVVTPDETNPDRTDRVTDAST